MQSFESCYTINDFNYKLTLTKVSEIKEIYPFISEALNHLKLIFDNSIVSFESCTLAKLGIKKLNSMLEESLALNPAPWYIRISAPVWDPGAPLKKNLKDVAIEIKTKKKKIKMESRFVVILCQKLPSEVIRDYGITTQKERLYLFELEFGKFPDKAISDIDNCGLSEANRLKIAIDLFQNNPELLISYFDKFDLDKESNRFEFAKKIILKYPDLALKNFEKFKLKDFENNAILARVFAIKMPSEMCWNIEKFKLDEPDKESIAWIIHEKASLTLFSHLSKFKLKDSEIVIKLIKEAAETNSNFIKVLPQSGITDKKIIFEALKSHIEFFPDQAAKGMSEVVTDQEQLYMLALKVLEKDPNILAENFSWIQLTLERKLKLLRRLSLNRGEIFLRYYMDYGIEKKHLKELIELTKEKHPELAKVKLSMLDITPESFKFPS